MPKLQSANELKEYAYRKLGYPMVEIQVDDTQAFDRIDEAIQIWRERAYDAYDEVFIPVNFTQADELNEYLTLPDDIVDVAKIYEGGRYSSEAMSDVRYQIMVDEVFGNAGATMLNYEMTMQNLELVSSYFALDRLFTFNNITHRLYPTTGKIIGPKCSDKVHTTKTDCESAGETWTLGNSMLIRAFRTLDPSDSHSIDLYDDDWLKQFTTALIKQQWGTNMKPFDGMPLPGGITVNGQQIFDEATEEIERLKEELLEDELPVDFAVG